MSARRCWRKTASSSSSAASASSRRSRTWRRSSSGRRRARRSRCKNVATVTLGPDFRRGALDKAGVEAVGGVVLMRYGENPLHVVERVKAKIKQLEAGPAAEDARRRPHLEGPDRAVLRPHRHRPRDDRHAQGGADRGSAHGRARSSSSSCCICAARFRSSSRCRCRSALCFILMYRLRRRLPTSCRSPASPSPSATWPTWASS